MKAGYLVANWNMKTLNAQGMNAAISLLAGSVGYGIARYLVSTVAGAGVHAAATVIAGYLGAGSSFAGPLGAIIGYATGYA